MDFLEGLQSHCPKTTRVLFFIGLIIAIRKLIGLLRKVYILTLRRRKDLKKIYGAGSWAFVTGSSEGIGRSIALALAEEGFNIILSARTLKKLEAVRTTITDLYPKVQVKILPADYKKACEWSYASNLLDEIVDLDISIVVNNVGVDVLEKYEALEPTVIEDLIKLNCFPVAYINRYFIPLMLKRNKQKNLRSTIVNVSSLAGIGPMPYYNIYTATKAYVDKLSRSLSYQYSTIDFLSLRPSEVSTPMTFNKNVDIFTITSEQCAKGLLDQMGQAEATTYGHWRHQLQGWLTESVPEGFFIFIFKNFVAPADIKWRQEARKKQG